MYGDDRIIYTEHTDVVTDVAISSNGQFMASASEDGTICIFTSVTLPSTGAGSPGIGNAGGASGSTSPSPPPFSTWKLYSTINTDALTESRRGHDEDGAPGARGFRGKDDNKMDQFNGGVTCVAWAPHTVYNNVLTACTAKDAQVTLWAGNGSTQKYNRIYSSKLEAMGLCVAWAPPEYGGFFAVGCAHGMVAVFIDQSDAWSTYAFRTHDSSCRGLSFAPFYQPGLLLSVPLETELPSNFVPHPIPIIPPRMVTCGGGGGGGDKSSVRVWTHSFAAPRSDGGMPESVWNSSELPMEQSVTWTEVAWAPNVGLPYTYIAAGSEEGVVVVWWQDGPNLDEWNHVTLPRQPASISKLSWSQVGTFLLVSCTNGSATMWLETAQGEWKVASELYNPKP